MNTALALPPDSLGIATVHIRSWQAAYADILEPSYLASLSIENRSNRWREIISSNETKTSVSRAYDEIVGFVNYGKCRDEGASNGRGEINAIYVAPWAWGQGIGRDLMAHALNELKALGFTSVSLQVLAANVRARKFYESLDFEEIVNSEKSFELGGRQIQELLYVRHDA